MISIRALVTILWLFTAGVLGVSLNVGAYAAIVVEASIRAVPKSQYEATQRLFKALRNS